MSTNTMNKSNHRQFIFGYGSLICYRSRAITAPSLASKPAIPVIVEHLTRTWSARVPNKNLSFLSSAEIESNETDIHGLTAMGIERTKDTKCSGVLIEVDDNELGYFDTREEGYDRIEIDLIHIWELDGNNDEKNKEEHIVLQRASIKRLCGHESNSSGSNDIENIKVWVYVPKVALPANKNYPIAQSYVDIIMRGCLDYSHNFVEHFISTTHGWWDQPKNNVKFNITKSEYNETSDKFMWVEDRNDPLYIRADIDWSKEKAEILDDYLQAHLPYEFTKRKNLDRILSAADKYEDEFD